MRGAANERRARLSALQVRLNRAAWEGESDYSLGAELQTMREERDRLLEWILIEAEASRFVCDSSVFGNRAMTHCLGFLHGRM
eukprot:SAG11_NODE_1212_length_5506_cov_3.818384_8_plen_83_part_00